MGFSKLGRIWGRSEGRNRLGKKTKAWDVAANANPSMSKRAKVIEENKRSGARGLADDCRIKRLHRTKTNGVLGEFRHEAFGGRR